MARHSETAERHGSSDVSPGRRTAEAGGEFLRALVADIAAVVCHAWRRAIELSAAIPTVFAPRPATSDARGDNHQRRSWRVPGAIKLAALFIVTGSIAAIAMLLWAIAEVPMERALAADMQPSILVESADGRPMTRRGPLKLADIEREAFPEHLVQAVLSIEDRNFYRHWGIDFRGGARALYRNIIARRVVEGGSTITQQLVKITMLGSERTISRKLREIFLAVWLEHRLGKEEILTRYLNEVYLGASAHGMPAAARRYFSREVSELTLAEAAMLAGIIRAPSHLNPLRNYEGARARAAVVLDAMVASGAIDKEAAEQAKAKPAEINRVVTATEGDTWFADWAAQQALQLPGSFSGNIRVRTTMEPELQRLAEEVVAEMLNGAGAKRAATQAALVAMRPDGAVLAMVGGRDYEESEFNRAVQGMRQPGSAFKVFVYYAALRNGLQPQDVILDAPLELEDIHDEWEPANFDRQYYGEVSLSEAFARSLNAATVRLALEVGLDEVVAAARDLGIESQLAETPSLALGTYELSLLELTSAFAAIRAGVGPIRPWGIVGVSDEGEGPLFAMGPPVGEQHSLGAAHEPMLGLLNDVIERGTGRRAAIGDFAAGKTGTSQRFRDAWFIGFTQNIVVGVWVGNDNGDSMDEVVGGQLPAETWRAFVTRATPLLPHDDTPRFSPRPDDRDPDGRSRIASSEIKGDLDVSEGTARIRVFRGTAVSDERVLIGRGQEGQVAQEQRARLVERMRGARSGDASAMNQVACDIEACRRQYRSFRASDCTYQPFGGGPRRLCTRGDSSAGADEPVATGSVPSSAARRLPQHQCNYQACARQYRSFRSSDCTYQPHGGGPRRICRR